VPVSYFPSARRAASVLAAALLAAGPATLASAAPASAAPGSGLARAAAPAATVPCPVSKPPPLPGRKPPPLRPAPPPREADAPVVGGIELSTPGLLVPVGAPAPPKGITADAWLVADLDTGEILGACAPHVRHLPASTQKLLTALTALPRLDPKQVVTVTDADLKIERGSSAVGLVKGGRYTVETIALGMLLNSGNDAAHVLARLVGGPQGIPGGVAAMNAEARRIGAFDTTAVTPSGLDGAGQFTSAYDLALISRAVFALPTFRKYTATLSTVIPPQPPKFPSFQIQNENRLLQRFPGAIGGKTGFTDLSRHTYVGAAERNGRRLVVTMLRGEQRPQKLWQQGGTLLEWGFALPAGASIPGKLVTPEEVATPSPEPEQPAAGPAPGAALTPSAGSAQLSTGQLTGLSLGGTAVALLVMVVVMRRRAVLRRRRRRRERAWQASF
jgi:D-alanyl-D-alanine carboxypeptidase (penicillin-binding protein 5/6)